MKLVQELGRRPDPWWGNNIVAIYLDSKGQHWKVSYNDASGIDSPWSKRVKVIPEEKLVTVWTEQE
jgi:hypothetical protein